MGIRLDRRVAGALLSLLLVSAVATACGSGSSSSGGTGGSPSSTPTAPPRTAGKAPTLSALSSSVQAQVTGNGTNDFDVTGLSKLTCDPPAVWKVGATFKCFGFDFADDEIGEYDGTVMGESGGQPQWNGQWSPK